MNSTSPTIWILSHILSASVVTFVIVFVAHDAKSEVKSVFSNSGNRCTCPELICDCTSCVEKLKILLIILI